MNENEKKNEKKKGARACGPLTSQDRFYINKWAGE
jgi:hypothetical protein